MKKRLVYSALDSIEVHMNKLKPHDVHGINIGVDISELIERVYKTVARYNRYTIKRKETG